MKEKQKHIFKYIILIAVLIIPFMYSFFYLKAYWDPYGKGNIDNIPIAIVNEDKGDKGQELIDSIKDSKKLKPSIVSNENAIDGLNEGKYYAVISIPTDFTKSMESIKQEKKHHAIITYSPNQKTNYLSSQIINNVVNVVEKNLDNKVNASIVDTLSKNVKTVPDKLSGISYGLGTLKDGTDKLSKGSNNLNQGLNQLKTNYIKFDQGLKQTKDGVDTLKNATNQFSKVNENLDTLSGAISTLKSGGDNLNNGINNYVQGTNSTLNYTQNLVDLINYTICPKVDNNIATEQEIQMCQIAKGLSASSQTTGNTNVINYLKASGNSLKNGSNNLNQGLTSLNTKVGSLSELKTKTNELQNGINQLSNGVNTLYTSSGLIQNGINQLSVGSNTLNTGINTIDSSVLKAKNTLDTNIQTTKKEVKPLSDLGKYSESPVTIKTNEVNKVSSYGTAFSPFFISIALWVGCLMMYIVLYYDKEERFGIFGINNKNRIQRTFAYHGLATLAAIILGILLQTLLDFKITNILLYYVTMILIANTFMAIIQFLIENFKDIGKFIALILLVLQLAASGGTFPIETVTQGFRWMNPILPMTYTNKLLKESLISIENNLLTQNILIVFMIFIVFITVNITISLYKQSKEK